MESMESPNRSLALGLLVILTGLMGGCSSGAHSTASRPPESSPLDSTIRPPESNPPIYLAPLTCWDTVSCCVERNPFTAVESCGADPAQIASILKTLAEIYATMESTPATEATSTAEGSEATQTGEQAETAAQPIPRWRRKCIMTYVECVDKKWVGRCDACLRRCVAQHKWPKDMCPDPQDQNSKVAP
jgi:hypothetical protein